MVKDEYELYKIMCRGCRKEKQCHDDATQCEDFLEALENVEHSNN